MYCKRCSRQVPENADFCPFCQADLRDVRALTPAAGPGTPVPPPRDSLGDKATAFTPSDVAEFTPGIVIANRYEVIRLLGKGGMGAVYEVRDNDLGANCALKVMHPHLLSSELPVERFIQEARVSLELADSHIIRVRDMGRMGRLRYLTMELLEGQSLREWLSAIKAEGRLAPVEVVATIIGQVLEALDYAHCRTIHRDIKPENIFLLGKEPNFQVKLLDFGIAKALDHETLTSTSSSMGTAWYVAPEQLEDARDIDARADLFAVGAVLYELLTGNIPHGRLRRPSEVREGLDPAWDKLVFDAIEAAPEHRPATAGAFLKRLRSLPVPGATAGQGAPLGGHRVEVEEQPSDERPRADRQGAAVEALPSGETASPVPFEERARREAIAAQHARDRALARRRRARQLRVGVVVVLIIAVLAVAGWRVSDYLAHRSELTAARSAVEEAIAAKDSDGAKVALAAYQALAPGDERLAGYADQIQDLEDLARRQAQQEQDSRELAHLLEGANRFLLEGKYPEAWKALGLYEEEGGNRGRAGTLRERVTRKVFEQQRKVFEKALASSSWPTAEKAIEKAASFQVAESELASWRDSLAKVKKASRLTSLEKRARAAIKQESWKEAEEAITEVKGLDGKEGAGLMRRLLSAMEQRIESGIESLEVKDLPPMIALYGCLGGDSGKKQEMESRLAKARQQLRAECRLPGRKAGESCAMVVSGVRVPMRWIPPGEDVLGSAEGEACRGGDENEWVAKFSHGFWMGQTEVTQALWRAVMEDNPSDFKECGLTCPVDSVSWDDIQEFLGKLNREVSGGEFRLPTEAEWEYAARAGSDGPFGLRCPDYGKSNCWHEVECLKRLGWYNYNAGEEVPPSYPAKNPGEWTEEQWSAYTAWENSGRVGPHPVGEKAPNAWGLRDMHGNVWEWCQDWYGAYPGGMWADYEGPSSGKFRVLRGGSWNFYASYLRSADRLRSMPVSRANSFGFRVVWVLPASQGAH